ncbi:MAG: hypothetical protein K8R18_02175 [Parvibaculum sp.]|uniref:hypothetical protein n=1 Tax=Parvibaculum sp. TaxID=2024848 RepID=UPI0025F60303|nr:hypothetical protein [Parvibaculum sp.]MCE9648407.1 hypothetical protein [Parvibaculum sp.]
MIAIVALGFAGLAGCAAPIVAGLTAAQVFSIAGLSATIMTGRDITEHAVSLVTGKDCRFIETLLRNGRSFCEEPNTVATKDDFHGVIALFDKDEADTGTKVAAASLDPEILGFAPIDRRAAEDFSLEIARKQNAPVEAQMLSFGMLSATFGSSFSYDLNMRGSLAGKGTDKLAMADTAPAKERQPARPSRADYFGL